jgi:translation initiation factor 2B subunit (eIF-2B alpha/beta/delta family)
VLEDLPNRLAANAWPLLEALETVVTISRSSAVAAVVEGAWARGWSGLVVVFDGTASGRGGDQARRLSAAGSAISRPDTAVSEILEKPSLVVLVGADAVGREQFINSAGTGNLLHLARRRELDTVLIADSGKDVDDDTLEEIIGLSPVYRDDSGEEWPIFEAVRLDLITTRVTE